eukprot:8172589-Pyramimonas_sp.AAC.1
MPSCGLSCARACGAGLSNMLGSIGESDGSGHGFALPVLLTLGIARHIVCHLVVEHAALCPTQC